MLHRRVLFIVASLCLLLTGCEPPEKIVTLQSTSYSCSYPSTWKLSQDANDESLEFNLGGGRLIFLSMHHPDNPTTLDEYCSIVTKGFPKNHHESNPEHTVSTEFTAEPVSIGLHKGLSTKFSVKTPQLTTSCLYRFFRFSQDNYVMFVEVFEEGHMKSMPDRKIAAFLSSIQPVQALQSTPPS